MGLRVLKLSKAAVGIGLVGLATATGAAALGLLLDEAGLREWAVFVALLGLTLFAIGVALALRWQSRMLTSISKASRSPAVFEAPAAFSPDDLGEVVRVVDSRIVGLIETLQDDTDHID